MIDGAFLQGTLEMPQNLTDAATQVQFIWNAVPMNRALSIVCTILAILALPGTRKIFPRVLDCIVGWRSCISMEHNLSDARTRNNSAAVCYLAIALLADRYRLYNPSFFGILPEWSRTLACFGALLAFFLLRLIIFLPLRPDGMNAEEIKALRRNCGTISIPTCLLMLLTAFFFNSFGAADTLTHDFLIVEAACGWLLSFSKSVHLLGARFSGLITFLYLCALEIIPAAALVASALVL